MTVARFVTAQAERFADRPAVVLGSQRLSYRRLDEESRSVAAGLLARGLSKGARVGMWVGNGPDWAIYWAAICRAGGVAVPLSTLARGAELRRMVVHADLTGLVVQRSILGQDQLPIVKKALPGLAPDGSPDLVLGAAPYLRWVVVTDDEPGPGWARGRGWLADRSGRWEALVDAAEAQMSPHEPAMMIYTSGTTADPKGVIHTHDNVLTKAAYLMAQVGITGNDRGLTVLPFFWVGGLSMSLLPLLTAGGTQYCLDRFDASAVLDLIEAEGITRCGFYPDQVNAICAEPGFGRRDLSSLRAAHRRLLGRDGPDVGVDREGRTMGLGMSETLGCYWWGTFPGDNSDIRDAKGQLRTPRLEDLQPGIEIRLAGPDGAEAAPGEWGEIQIRGACISPALHKQPRSSAFSADGFLRTGDMGERRDGTIVFRGRLKEMIKTSGANVAPAEVVAVILEVEGVEEAHVVGIPDEVRGEAVVAAVVARPGAHLDGEAVRQQVRANLSSFKVPRHVVVVDSDEIPRTVETQKVRRTELVELLARRVAAAAH